MLRLLLLLPNCILLLLLLLLLLRLLLPHLNVLCWLPIFLLAGALRCGEEGACAAPVQQHHTRHCQAQQLQEQHMQQ
jgi:hypothetical protein